jgi:flagellar basal body rod protein FlgC
MNPVCSSCSPIGASALQGMQKAEAQLGKAADRIAQLPNALNAGAAGASGDTVDLSAQMVALLGARDNFMANVEAFKTGDSMQRTLLNMVG